MNRRPVSDHPPLSYHRHYEFMFHCPFNQMNYLSPSADPLDSAEPRRLFFASSLPRNLTEQITECATSAHSRATPRTKWRSLVKATSFLNLLFSLSLSLSCPLIVPTSFNYLWTFAAQSLRSRISFRLFTHVLEILPEIWFPPNEGCSLPLTIPPMTDIKKNTNVILFTKFKPLLSIFKSPHEWKLPQDKTNDSSNCRGISTSSVLSRRQKTYTTNLGAEF